MSHLDDYVSALESAKEQIDFMIEDAKNPREDSLQAVFDSAETVQSEIMRALYLLASAA